MPMGAIVKSYETGVGGALGHIALVVGLGTMFGKMMAESGGAERVANTLIGVFGPKRVHWAMMVVALIVGLPVFFEVGFVLLIPIAFNVAKRTGTSMIMVGIPMVAGLSVVHGLIPPHPAALFAVTAYNADIGRTIMYALIVGIPTAIIAGPLFAKLISRFVVPNPDNPLIAQFVEEDKGRDLPGFGITICTILLPVALMLIGSWADLFFTPKTFANDFLRLMGNSVIALLIATLVSFYTFGKARGFNREAILKFTTECLAPIAGITLIVGAGAGFGRILIDGGVSKAIVELANNAHLSPLLLGWFVAALIRVATGSATVAMTTACGIVAPIVTAAGVTVRPELMVLATGAGSLILSHVNDGGFWLVKEYFNMTVTETFKTWTVAETIISVVALLLTLGLATVI
jgi:GntP family gluconate:H+ symporter